MSIIDVANSKYCNNAYGQECGRHWSVNLMSMKIL